jgi:hypothetical protein
MLKWLEHARRVKDPGVKDLLVDTFLLPTGTIRASRNCAKN